VVSCSLVLLRSHVGTLGKKGKKKAKKGKKKEQKKEQKKGEKYNRSVT